MFSIKSIKRQSEIIENSWAGTLNIEVGCSDTAAKTGFIGWAGEASSTDILRPSAGLVLDLSTGLALRY